MMDNPKAASAGGTLTKRNLGLITGMIFAAAITALFFIVSGV